MGSFELHVEMLVGLIPKFGPENRYHSPYSISLGLLILIELYVCTQKIIYNWKLDDSALINSKGEEVDCENENDIFDRMGLEYVPPRIEPLELN